MTRPIFSAPRASACTIASVRFVSCTACPVTVAERWIWREISLTEEESSSAAEATVCTPLLAMTAADATSPAWQLVCSAALLMPRAVPSSSVEAEVSKPTSWPMSPSNPCSISSSLTARSSLTSCSAFCSAASRSPSIMLSRKTSTAEAIPPISSRRSAPSISARRS